MAKHRIQIDLDRVTQLAARGLSHAQIAASLGIGARTLERRKAETAEMADAIEKGRAQGIEVIANALFENARSGNVTAQIFWLKAQAGWRDKPEEAADTTNTADLLRKIADKLPD